MTTQIRIALYTRDESVTRVLSGLAGDCCEVTSSDRDVLLKADLILVDLTFPRSVGVLERLVAQRNEGVLGTARLAAISTSPFALRRIPAGVDALIAKPLTPEAVQALLVGLG